MPVEQVWDEGGMRESGNGNPGVQGVGTGGVRKEVSGNEEGLQLGKEEFAPVSCERSDIHDFLRDHDNSILQSRTDEHMSSDGSDGGWVFFTHTVHTAVC